MCEHDAFLRAILERPNDDVPRLVYADYLDDIGQSERAWFIRFQCDPDNQFIHDGEREYSSIEANLGEWFPFVTIITGRKREKFGPNGTAYLADYGPPNLILFVGRKDRSTRERRRVELPIRRGFVASATCAWGGWLTYVQPIRMFTPIEFVQLIDIPDDGRAWTTTWNQSKDSYRYEHRDFPGVLFLMPQTTYRQRPMYVATVG